MEAHDYWIWDMVTNIVIGLFQQKCWEWSKEGAAFTIYEGDVLESAMDRQALLLHYHIVGLGQECSHFGQVFDVLSAWQENWVIVKGPDEAYIWDRCAKVLAFNVNGVPRNTERLGDGEYGL